MLTLRRSGLSSPAYRDWLDYVIVEDGRDVGEERQGGHSARQGCGLYCSRGRAGWPPDDTSIIAAPTSQVPSRHVRRLRQPIGAGTKEPVVVVGVDVMSLHHPHQMDRIGAAGKAAVSVVDVVADRLGAGEPLRADSDRAGAMLRLRHAMRHRPGFLTAG